MKKDRLGKLYDRFTPTERFRLAIEALARGDEEEVKRLADSCPRLTYRMGDLAYADRYKASMMMTMGVCLDLAPLLVILGRVEAFREVLPSILNLCEEAAGLAYLQGHEAGFKSAREAASETEPLPRWDKGNEKGSAIEEELQKITARFGEFKEGFVGPLEEVEQCIGREALTLWRAFAGICHEELLLEPETLLKVWFEPMVPEIKKLKDIPDLSEADQDRLKEYEAGLKAAWSELVRKL